MSEDIKRSDLDAICKKLDFILDEVRETKEKVSMSSERIVRMETKIESAEHDREEIKSEQIKIWNHFSIMKEELKKDLKEYIGIVSKQEAAKIKIWVYGMAGTIAIAIITYLIKQ